MVEALEFDGSFKHWENAFFGSLHSLYYSSSILWRKTKTTVIVMHYYEKRGLFIIFQKLVVTNIEESFWTADSISSSMGFSLSVLISCFRNYLINELFSLVLIPFSLGNQHSELLRFKSYSFAINNHFNTWVFFSFLPEFRWYHFHN